MLSEELSRRHATAVKLRHVSERKNLFTIDVMLESELDEERDEEANEPGNKRPWKRLICRGGNH